MRSTHRHLLALPVVLLVAACGAEPERAMSADLQKDLELATSTSIELANRPQTAVTSALESAVPGRAAEGDRAEAPTPRRRAPQAAAPTRVRYASAEAPAPEPTEVATADDAAPIEEIAPTVETVPADAGPEETVLTGGPVVTSDGVGTGRPRDPGGWDDPIPGGGVVIRGGGIGDGDHCQYHPPGGIRIGGRYPPIRGPIYGRAPVRYPSVDGARTRTGSTARPRGPSRSTEPASRSGGGRTRTRGRM